MAAPTIDIKLEAFLTQSADTTATLQLTNPRGITVIKEVNGLLRDTLAEFKAIRAKVKKERGEADEAARTLDRMEYRASELFPGLYNDLQAHRWQMRNGDPEEARQYEAGLETALTGITPSRFDELGIDRTIELLDGLADFAQRYLGANHVRVVEARAVHGDLHAARSLNAAEANDLQLAVTELMAARDQVRRNYSAARKMVAGVLELDNYDDLYSVMPSLNSIYRSSGATEKAEAPAPA